MDLHLCVIPLQECNTEDPGYQRLLKGPIDIYEGAGYNKELLSNFRSEYYLLFYEKTCVGFCSIYEEEDATILNEFEIYHEFRGYSYGNIFAKHLVNNFIPNTKRLEFYEIMSNAFLFWWRCLGGIYFVKHIADVIGAPSAVNLQRFEEWLTKYKHRDQLNTYTGFKYVAGFLTEFPHKKYAEIAAMVEATPWYQKIFMNRNPTPPRPCNPGSGEARPTAQPPVSVTQGEEQPAQRPGTPFPQSAESLLQPSQFQSLLFSPE
jgi:hypothetical protein